MTVVRRLVGALGEVMMTAGVLILLFVLWQVWWTDVVTQRSADQELEQVQELLAAAETGETGPSVPDPGELNSGQDSNGNSGQDSNGDESADAGVTLAGDNPEYGQAFGVVHLPTIGETRVVKEGVGLDVLDQGVLGHYPDNQMPGEVGNFAVAGHRTTYSAPLWSIADLEEGDPIIVETVDEYHVYRFERRRIVEPHQTEVIAPVPDQLNEEPTEAHMVMTACHPFYSAAQRIVAYSVLEESTPREDGPPSVLEASR